MSAACPCWCIPHLLQLAIILSTGADGLTLGPQPYNVQVFQRKVFWSHMFHIVSIFVKKLSCQVNVWDRSPRKEYPNENDILRMAFTYFHAFISTIRLNFPNLIFCCLSLFTYSNLLTLCNPNISNQYAFYFMWINYNIKFAILLFPGALLYTRKLSERSRIGQHEFFFIGVAGIHILW